MKLNKISPYVSETCVEDILKLFRPDFIQRSNIENLHKILALLKKRFTVMEMINVKRHFSLFLIC